MLFVLPNQFCKVLHDSQQSHKVCAERRCRARHATSTHAGSCNGCVATDTLRVRIRTSQPTAINFHLALLQQMLFVQTRPQKQLRLVSGNVREARQAAERPGAAQVARRRQTAQVQGGHGQRPGQSRSAISWPRAAWLMQQDFRPIVYFSVSLLSPSSIGMHSMLQCLVAGDPLSEPLLNY